MKLLERGRAGKAPVFHTCKCELKIHEPIVANGMAITPSTIEALARQGIAVSTPNADAFTYDSSSSGDWNIPPELMRDSDRNSLWEMSQLSKARIMNARKRDKERFT